MKQQFEGKLRSQRYGYLSVYMREEADLCYRHFREFSLVNLFFGRGGEKKAAYRDGKKLAGLAGREFYYHHVVTFLSFVPAIFPPL